MPSRSHAARYRATMIANGRRERGGRSAMRRARRGPIRTLGSRAARPRGVYRGRPSGGSAPPQSLAVRCRHARDTVVRASHSARHEAAMKCPPRCSGDTRCCGKASAGEINHRPHTQKMKQIGRTTAATTSRCTGPWHRVGTVTGRSGVPVMCFRRPGASAGRSYCRRGPRPWRSGCRRCTRRPARSSPSPRRRGEYRTWR